MRLQVILPSGILLDEAVTKVIATAQNGSFCLLPRHVDCAAALIPGLFAFTTPESGERFLALDEGILVKQGSAVLVSTWNAVAGPLGELRQALRRQMRERGEQEQKARSALDRLEASLVRQVLDWEGRNRV